MKPGAGIWMARMWVRHLCRAAAPAGTAPAIHVRSFLAALALIAAALSGAGVLRAGDDGSLDVAVWRKAPVCVPGGASFSGSPSYVAEFTTTLRDNGGPLSDLGSHSGVKAGVEGLAFATVRHYACIASPHVFDYSRTGLAGVSRFSLGGQDPDLAPARARHVAFDFLSWDETAAGRSIDGTARVAFVDTDVYAIWIDIRNGTDHALDFDPTLAYSRRAQKGQAGFDPATGVAVESCQIKTLLGSIGAIFGRTVPPEYAGEVPLTEGLTGQNWLACAPGFPVAAFSQGAGEPGFLLRGRPAILPAGQTFSTVVVFAYSPDSAGAASTRAVAARDALLAQPGLGRERVCARARQFFAGLPRPHCAEPAYTDLFRTAATALQMSLYAPRNAMKSWGCVPTKIHYNWFWLWDSALQSLGLSEIDPSIAQQVVSTIFQSQRPDGFIAHMTSDGLGAMTHHSQSPVFGFTASRLADRDPDRSRAMAFERAMLDGGARYIDWWGRERDRDGDGLLELFSQDESGWDNSPRRNFALPARPIPYLGTVGEVAASRLSPLDGVDLNAWMYLYFQAMARWSADAGDDAGRARWTDRARALATRIDAVLWDEGLGCWLDAHRPPGQREHRRFPVLTPAIWFPAFAGATRDLGKARRVIEQHLLDPAEFFGPFPIPSVAYNDPAFAPATPGWTGAIWMVTTYVALQTLFEYGYDTQAQVLRDRTLAMLADQGGMHGIWESYDPLSGRYKNGDSDGSYCAFQFGWSAAFTMEILLDRYQEERFVFDDTERIAGYIRRATVWSDRTPLYEVAPGQPVPRVEIRGAAGAPLLKSTRINLTLTDPFGPSGGSSAQVSVTVRIAGIEHSLTLGQESTIDLTPQ